MTNKKKSPVRKHTGSEKRKNSKIDSTNILAQRQHLLEWLRKKPITTVEARHDLNIMAPAARIYELRHQHGHEIRTDWVNGKTAEGFKHRFGRYTLIRERRGVR